MAALLTIASPALAQRVEFSRDFAPSEGLTAAPEKPLRDEICLNGSWDFQPLALPADFRRNSGNPPAMTAPAADKWSATKIRIPSPWNVNAFPYGANQANRLGPGGDFRAYPSYPVEWDKAEMGWLRRGFTVPSAWRGKRLFVHFEAVAGAAEVRVNGKKVGEHFDAFLPFDVDITDAVKDGENEILVGVRKGDLFNLETPAGRRTFVAGSMWGESIVGIWQDVYLQAVSPIRIVETLVQPLVDGDALKVDVVLRNDTDKEEVLEVGGSVQPWMNLAAKDVLGAPEPKWKLGDAVLEIESQRVSVPARGTANVSAKVDVAGRLDLWSPDAPNLYGLTMTVTDEAVAVDKKYTRFGYREWKLSATKLQLNGNDIDIRGDAWHFLGIPQMTRRYAWAWYTAVKEANGNCVRLHAQPYPRLYLEMADEMGMLVLDETGIWGSGNSARLDTEEYWKAADRHVTDLVMRDRNHPSVMGFSVANEILVIMRIRKLPKEAFDRAYGYYTKWVSDIARIAPTHPWVSGDGEEEAEGTLPTVIGHYGGTDAPKRWAKSSKPWGVGECGMAYYGTPMQVSKYNGAAAYTSMNARLEGCAIEAYELITKTHRDLNAAYSSVFNIAWYALQPLELGLKETSRAPEVADGVWFGPFVEGQPGAQPERLGPYCTTFNPGYDPSLPLYRKWPMFDAIQAANAPGKPAASVWGHRPQAATESPVATTKPASILSVAVLASDRSTLASEFELMGVPASAAGEGAGGLLVIDGSAPATNGKDVVTSTLSAGGTVLVWRPTREALSALNALLPAPLELTDRVSPSLIRVTDDPIIAGITNADTYFAELKPDVILDGGLAGPLLQQATVLLEAPAVDWRVWNNRPEVIKTGSVVRSERERKSGGAALAVVPSGGGRIVIANLSGLSATPERVETARKILAHLGVQLGAPRDLISGGIFTNAGTLRRALFLGRFEAKDRKNDPGNPRSELPDGAAFDAPTNGMAVGERKWTEGTIDPATQMFEFGSDRMKLPGSNRDATAYASFWVHSPRGLDDVLGQPDVPRVDLLLQGSDRVAAVWINGKTIEDDAAAASAAKTRQVYPALVLKRGWNHVMIKLAHGEDKWQFGASLRCSDPKFLSTIQASLEAPRE